SSEAADAAETGGGHGLLGMRERAAALHGACETGPLPGGGFRVHVRLPLQPSGPQDPQDPLGKQPQEGASA
ncbi:MAG: ATP-binding protein, partial [Streptomyces sp.]|uniref:ATP-binding protein n=1 Tax=Streptomyces sp. TaxID=1931 RepID=UPI003D6AFF01